MLTKSGNIERPSGSLRYERIAGSSSAFESVPFHGDVIFNDQSIRELWQQDLGLELGYIQGRINSQDGLTSIIIWYHTNVLRVGLCSLQEQAN